METQTANRQLVVTRVGETLYGIDIDVVHEIIPVPEITTVPKSPENMLGVINVRGAVVPVADLRACLGFQPWPFTNDTRIVLVTYDTEKIGLVVDAVTEVTTLPSDAFQSLTASAGESAFLRAVARFQNRLVLEIDHNRVIEDGLDVPPSNQPVVVEEVRVGAERTATEPEAEDAEPLDVDLLETSFQLLAPHADLLAERFYERLFETAPAVRDMFPDDMAAQRRALIASIVTTVNYLRTPEKLAPFLASLGERHVAYGAVAAHYDVVGQVLLETMAELAGDAWNDELQAAWALAYGAIKGIMLSGAESAELKAAA